MKTAIQILIVLIFLSSCVQQERQYEQEIHRVDNNQSESTLTEKVDEQIIEKKFGEELFKSILDTVTINGVSVDFLINNQWVYRPFDNCESFLKFQENGKGVSYNCEIEEDYEMTYQIEGNKVFISEYDIPHVDNEENKKIKYRDDTYVYNGQSLIMVDSRMYNINGLDWTPKIKVVIAFERKKY
ncbi:hypothetical protein OKW21_006731 [Catalinimonas alkaloidigena]|uniref:hypothetical protein n=1 Tax=Catalinimonas alkaloidigena TaxID=1075417 RepID=UPI00240534C0|nr:hypothetical protein [Catalinimonas alkaloidigena]MDF9801422.1 hypothetical protein [Catalinimonas alkaloidigena]